MEESADTLKEFVINSLARIVDRDDVIKEVCLRQNVFWDEGKSLVDQIEHENSVQLQKRKSPLLLILSMLFAAVGLIWGLFVFYALVFPIYSMWRTKGGLIDGALWIYNFWGFFPQLLMSTGMAISGILGINHALKKLKGENTEDDDQGNFQ